MWWCGGLLPALLFEIVLQLRTRILAELPLGFQDESSSWVRMDPNHLLATIDNYKAEVRGLLAESRGSSTGAVGFDFVSEVSELLS